MVTVLGRTAIKDLSKEHRTLGVVNKIPKSTVGFIGYVVAPLYEMYVAIMKRCATLNEMVDSSAVEECLVILQKNKDRYQLLADGHFVDVDEEEEELKNMLEDLKTVSLYMSISA